jgi:YD repeat-containing protein
MVLASTPDGNVHYSYDARNLVTEISFSDGSWVRYTYDANHRLIEVRDSSGHIEPLAAITLSQLARNIALHTAPAWIISVRERIARLLIPEAQASGLAIPAGIVIGIFLIAQAQIINTPYNPDGACCGDYSPPTDKPRNLKTFWLDQVGVLSIGDLGSSSSGRTYDKAGLLVSPKACGLKPPGNCEQKEWEDLEKDVTSKCDVVERSCKGDTLKPDLPVFRDRQRACAEAREKLNRQCFFGGNKGHRDGAHEAWEGYAKCIYWMSK